MELKTLKSFVAVATLKNFSAAARKLNTIQPAVSRHVLDLEDELGVQLIQLEKEHFVLFSRKEAVGLFDQIISACQKEKFAPMISSQPLFMQTVLTQVAAGLGVSIMPGCVKKMYTQGCVFIPIKKQKPSIPTQLHYRSEPILPTVRDFVSLTIEAKQDIQRQMLE